MDGILIVDKPQDWTSFDVCAKIRNLTHTKKVGHCGTLDPMATGVLPVFLGSATKTISQIMGADKEYIGEFTLGAVTDTMDSTGKFEIPNPKFEINSNFQIPNSKQIQEIFKKYSGKQMQKPPMFSAKKINGQPLYKLARKGIEIDRPDKEIEVYSLDLLDINDSRVKFRVKCSKGTYVRVLVHDMGYELGCGAYLSALRRTAAGEFRIEQSHTMDEIITLSQDGKLDTIILSAQVTSAKEHKQNEQIRS